ncbi:MULTISPECIES: Uma2 family endonuclease [unclassified Paenibacillus]|uniref:Uma2 family endonuclease n=1 Tax=unclassified Paenibacillus TaxID=185978 RepID=UPI003642ED05
MLYELETDERYEFWNGEKIIITPDSTDHEYVVVNVMTILNNYVRSNKLGKVFGSNTAAYLHADVTRKDFRLPDISYVSTDRLDIVQAKGIFGAPDLIVEIVSPGKKNAERDLVEKFQLYEQFGVREYWIVKPFVEKVELFYLTDNKYERVEQSHLFPSIELAHEEIFE